MQVPPIVLIIIFIAKENLDHTLFSVVIYIFGFLYTRMLLSCSLSFILTTLWNEVVKYCKMSFSFASWIFSHEWFQVIYLGQEHPRYCLLQKIPDTD